VRGTIDRERFAHPDGSRRAIPRRELHSAATLSSLHVPKDDILLYTDAVLPAQRAERDEVAR
jgi:hypothetical protein